MQVREASHDWPGGPVLRALFGCNAIQPLQRAFEGRIPQAVYVPNLLPRYLGDVHELALYQ